METIQRRLALPQDMDGIIVLRGRPLGQSFLSLFLLRMSLSLVEPDCMLVASSAPAVSTLMTRKRDNESTLRVSLSIAKTCTSVAKLRGKGFLSSLPGTSSLVSWHVIIELALVYPIWNLRVWPTLKSLPNLAPRFQRLYHNESRFAPFCKLSKRST